MIAAQPPKVTCPSCDGIVLQLGGRRPGPLHCTGCGAWRHPAVCHDPETGEVDCVCGLEVFVPLDVLRRESLAAWSRDSHLGDYLPVVNQSSARYIPALEAEVDRLRKLAHEPPLGTLVPGQL